MSTKTIPKKSLFYSILILGTLLICFSILEIGIRIFFPQSDLRIGQGYFFRYDPVLGFEGVPNAKGYFATSQFKTLVTHNKEGFRDIDHEHKNHTNTFRILALGDSYTWGHGVENNQIYVKLLENYDTNIEVINMGGPGGDPPGELKVYKFRGLEYDHDIVLLGFYVGNDIVSYYPQEDDSPPQYGYNEKGEFVLIGKVQPPEIVEKIRKESLEKYSPKKYKGLKENMYYWLVQHIQLYTFIDNFQNYYLRVIKSSPFWTKIKNIFGIENKYALGFLNYCKPEDSEEIQYGWNILYSTLETLKHYSSEAKAKLYVVIIPHVVQTSKNIYDYELIRSGHDPSSFDLEKPNNKLAEMCNKLGIDYLDLLPVMKEESSQGKLLYFPRDAHWNAEGHRIAAREIYKDLTGRGWLQ